MIRSILIRLTPSSPWFEAELANFLSLLVYPASLVANSLICLSVWFVLQHFELGFIFFHLPKSRQKGTIKEIVYLVIASIHAVNVAIHFTSNEYAHWVEQHLLIRMSFTLELCKRWYRRRQILMKYQPQASDNRFAIQLLELHIGMLIIAVWFSCFVFHGNERINWFNVQLCLNKPTTVRLNSRFTFSASSI